MAAPHESMTQPGARPSAAARVVAAFACGLLMLVAACGGGTDSDASTSSSDVSTESTPTTAPATVDDSEFCDIFRGLSSRRQQAGDGFERYEDEAAWTRGVENVERIAASAPEEIASQAETYLQLVTERRDLAASYEYEPVPMDVKLEFGRDHAQMQHEANELIAFAQSECTGVE